MEVIKRKIQGNVIANRGDYHASLIDNERLSMRWTEKKEKKAEDRIQQKAKELTQFEEKRAISDEDVVINFTIAETALIRKVLQRRD